MSLEKKIIGKTIVNAQVFAEKISDKALKKMLRRQDMNQFINNVVGCKFLTAERRAKFLMTKVEKNDQRFYIVVHLAMAGKWLAANKLEDLSEQNQKHNIVQFTLDDGSYLVYSDHRRFGAISIHTEAEYLQMDSIHGLGPEPFWDKADETFLENIRKKKFEGKAVKGEIMNQGVVAGIGNIYACEAIHVLGIHPEEKVKDLTDNELKDIFHVAKETMAFSITVGGSSVNDYVNGDGMTGSFQNYLKVYDQKTCECGEEIQRIDVAGRTTHFCPSCQKLKKDKPF
ncbi:MAG: hypothetical protein K0R18_1009 [Bacillales bacterium]|nr:hypothetical protein [Bacillales bacterium]